MANKVTFTLEAKTSGLKEANETAKSLNKNMTEAAESAKRLSGTKLAAAAYKAAANPAQESIDYGRSRSLRPGGTGASARDFAQEAQGLGGLVRLYATYAANIFAVGAAYRALSNAMDTTNMVQGLNQLGAASGMALGSLSKELVKATDGAISLREAMESVAKASSSGMSSKDILRMGEVAKKASQALGVDMADAVNRITRGITKLEPELLDEIGIFTRVDSAVQAYAKSTGKAVSSLTDFERRMAFANAVLEEGEKKFNAINIDTNPYTKLTAAIKDAAQKGLELVNVVLTPLVKFLGESPTALMTVLAGIAGLIVKQALPAIGQFKAGLASMADEATALSVQKAADAEAARAKIDKIELDRIESMADDKLRIVEQSEARIKSIRKDGFASTSLAAKLLEKDLQDVTEADLQAAQAQAENTKRRKAHRQIELETIQAIREHKKAEEDLTSAKVRARQAIDAEKQGFSTLALTVKAAENAQRDAIKSSIVSNAAYNGSLIGITGAMRLVKEDIANANIQLGRFEKATLIAKSGVAALGGQIATIGTALSGLLGWVGLIISAVAIFDSIFSKASKQLGNFDSAVNSVEESTDNLKRTLETINASNPFSVKSLEAQGQAMMEFSNSVAKLAKSADEALKALSSSAWDRFKDNIKGIFGGGVQNNFEEALAKSITGALDALNTGPIKAEAEAKILQLLGIKSLKELSKALKDVQPGSQVIKELNKILNASAIETSNVASRAREFGDAFKKAQDDYKAFQKEFEVKGTLVTFATSSIESLDKLSANLRGPVSAAVSSLLDLTRNIAQYPIFGLETSNEIASYSKEVEQINTILSDQAGRMAELNKLREEQVKLAEKQRSVDSKMLEETNRTRIARGLTPLTEVQTRGQLRARANLESTNKALVRAQDLISEASARAAEISAQVSAKISEGIQSSINILVSSIDATLAKGSTYFKSAIVSSFGSMVGSAKAESRLQLQEIGSEQKWLQIQLQMLRHQAQIEINTGKSAAIQQKQDLIAKQKAGGSLTEAEGKQLVDLDSRINSLNKAEAKLGIKDPREILKGLGDLDAESRKLLSGFAMSVAGVMQKLNDLGQKAAAVKFSENIKSIEERNAEAQKGYERDLKALDDKKAALTLEQSLSAAEKVNAEESLAQEQNRTTSAKERAAVLGNIETLTAKISALEGKAGPADAELLDSARSERARLETELVAISNREDIESRRIKLDLQNKIFTISKQELDNSQKINDLVFEGSQLSNNIANAKLEASQTELERLNASGTLTTEQFLQAKRALEFEKEKSALTNKLISMEFNHAKKMAQLALQLQQAYKTNNQEAINRIQAEIDGENNLYQQKVANEQQLSQLKLDNIDSQIDYELKARDREFQKGVADSVMTALFEGGKAGAAKLRDTVVNALREPVQIVVNALINPISSAINSFVGSTVNGVINSGLSSLFGAGSTMTGVASTFGSYLATGFMNTVSGSGFAASWAAGSQLPGAAGLGMQTGALLPYAAVAAVVLNVLGVFRKTKQVQSALIGTLGEGDIQDARVMRKSGTLLSGPDYWVEKLGVNEASSMIQDAWKVVKNNTIDMAKSLGLATDQVKNFTTTLGTDKLKGGVGMTGISLTGADGKPLSEQDVNAKIAEALDTANNELAELIIGSWETTTKTVTDTLRTWTGEDLIESTTTREETTRTYKPSEYAKLGETAIETLTRLATSLQSANGFFELIGHTMFEASLAGGDMASKLMDAVGGIDQFNQQSAFFFQNFFSESEQFEMKSKSLNANLKRLADDDTLDLTAAEIASLTDGVGDSKEEFKNLVLGLDLTTESGRKTYAALMDVAPAFVEVADAADSAVEKAKELADTVGLTAENISSIIVDGYMSGVDGAEIGKMVANTIQRGVQQALIQGVANQISSMITTQIVSPILQSIVAGGTVSAAVSTSTMNTVVSQARSLMSALAEVFNSPEFQQLLADLGNLNFNFPNLNVTPAYEYTNNDSNNNDNQSDKEDFSAIDSAFNALKKAIEAEKKILQEQLETAKDNLDKLKQVYDTLTDNIRDLRNSVDSTAALSAIQGQQYLNSILTSGVIGDPDKVSEAIEAVRGQLENTAFASKFEEDRAKLILAGQLDAIKDLTGEQMTEAEQTIAALEEQISQLDLILEQAQAQVDAIKGVDNSVLSVAEALARLQQALTEGTGDDDTPIDYTTPIRDYIGIVKEKIGELGFSGLTTESYTGTNYTGSSSVGNGSYTYNSAVSDAAGFSSGPGESYSTTGTRAWTAANYAAKNPDVVSYYNQNESLIKQLGQASSLTDYMLYHFITYGIKEGRQFAKGGIFDSGVVTAPTVFDASLMGEAGPEAIMPLGKLSDGSLGVRTAGGGDAAVVAELQRVSAELAQMKQYIAKTAKSTEESRKLLDDVVRGGEAITVESEIATF